MNEPSDSPVDGPVNGPVNGPVDEHLADDGVPNEPRVPFDAELGVSNSAEGASEEVSGSADDASVWSVTEPMPLSMPPFLAFGGPPPESESQAPEPEPVSSSDSPASEAVVAPRRPRRRALVGAVAAAVVVAGGLGGALGAGLSSSGPVISTNSTAGTTNVSRIAAAVDPAVVDITTVIASGQGTEEAAGTGMIISSSGLVLTNNHVVAGATSISVAVQGSNRTYSVRVLGEDPTSDVALLQLQGASGLPTVNLSTSDNVTLGQSVVAIGNALGLGRQPSVVRGTVTALNRTISASDESGSSSETLHGLIETNAPIVPGDSGGPLVDASGTVVGMDTAAANADTTSTTLGFAIPISHAMQVVHAIEAGDAGNGVMLGKAAFLGVIETQDGGFGSASTGVPISAVVEGGPAASAGLSAGDTIVSVGGTPVTSFSGLQAAVASHRPGEVVSVGVIDEEGASGTVSVTLGGIVP